MFVCVVTIPCRHCSLSRAHLRASSVELSLPRGNRMEEGYQVSQKTHAVSKPGSMDGSRCGNERISQLVLGRRPTVQEISCNQSNRTLHLGRGC